MKTRHKAVPAVYALFERHGALLFTLRQNTGFADGKYGVPAGHVEAGETITEALVREVAEETGLHIDARNCEFVHLMYREKRDETGERIDIFFRVRRWDGEPVNPAPSREYWTSQKGFEAALHPRGKTTGCSRRGGMNAEPEKCARLEWLLLDALPENVVKFQRHAIECWQRRLVFSELGWHDETMV